MSTIRSTQLLSSLRAGGNESEFAALSPSKGVGFTSIDVQNAVPDFLKDVKYRKGTMSKTQIWAFDGNKGEPHYRNVDSDQTDLKGKIGEDYYSELVAMASAITSYVEENLPPEERERMVSAKTRLALDLAELRVNDGTSANVGHDVHLDMGPREGMVLVIPICGSRTTVFHDGPAQKQSDPSRITGDLISGLGRWTQFHNFQAQEASESLRLLRSKSNSRVLLPAGICDYWKSRSSIIPADLFPDAAGVLPTVHRAGAGPRTVIVLNFSYVQVGAPSTIETVPERGQ